MWLLEPQTLACVLANTLQHSLNGDQRGHGCIGAWDRQGQLHASESDVEISPQTAYQREDVNKLLNTIGGTMLTCAVGDSGTRELFSAAAAVAAAVVAGASRAQWLQASDLLSKSCFACRMCVHFGYVTDQVHTGNNNSSSLQHWLQ